ncbi:fatty acid--CoA ligase family protein [Thiomicrorhabdus indica]|uniref:class I adenylate-forming enzyme family protein n=1 Tax=Thiomicrorhabdus indica TaxID=2267253 RepID=UPI002AA7FAA2|nr:fatty acid--CoA ligase family protein [Thiomicrorhabdus indica]
MAVLFERFVSFAKKTPQKVAFIEGDLQLTYEQLLQQVEMHSQRLQAFQNQQQSRLRVLSVCEKLSDNLYLALALAKLNGTLIPANAQFTADQLVEFATAVDANLILTDSEIKFSGIHQLLPAGRVFFMNDFFKHSVSDPLRTQKDEVVNSQNHYPEDDSFLIALSSGSTGKPKPIVISQASKLGRAQQSIDLYGLNSKDVVLNASPFFHSLGQRLSFVPLMTGATLVVLPKFTPKSWIEAVEKNRVSFTIPVATHLYALQPVLEENFSRLTSLQTLVTSSAPIDTDFKQQFAKEVGCELHEIYGATEVAIATNLAPEDFSEKVHTVGVACKDIEIRILDENRQRLPAGQTGEIAVKTPLMFSGYYKLPELTHDSMVNGFFRTGDLGYWDEDGFLVYVSRQKDVIITGGINIYPAVIENALTQVTDLTSVCVIGVNDALFGEVVIAICVGDSELEGELRQIANQKLASYQRPMRYFFVESLPLTPSGKIDKMALREQYNNLGEDWSALMRAMLYR